MDARSVCAVVVSYKPSPAFLADLSAIAEQVGQIVVVDNGSSLETEQQLLSLEQEFGYKVFCNHQNLGLATALNLGAKYAMGAGFSWIATFDQDSRISEGFVSTALETYQRAPHPEQVGLIVPIYMDRKSGAKVNLRRARSGEILAAMTSGSLIPTPVLG
jgi:rhamnosyltransferase